VGGLILIILSRSYLVKIPFALYSIRQKYGRAMDLASPFLLSTLLSVSSAMPILSGISAANAQEAVASEPTIYNKASYSYLDPQSGITFEESTNEVAIINSLLLTDPRGRILGCGGLPLKDYTGFQVGLYEPDPTDATGTELGQLLNTTTTELPDVPNNGVPAGLNPNVTNQNPFPLSNATEGYYSFLLDRSRGQLAVGKVYILVVDPPKQNATYSERRVKLEIIAITPIGNQDQVSYRATSLDGMPIAVNGAMTVNQTVAVIQDADRTALELLGFAFSSTMCQANQIQITKSGDRATASIGDIVIYRLTLRNISDGNLNSVTVKDTLPVGFHFLDKSVRSELADKKLTPTWTQNGRSLTFHFADTLPQNGSINLVYAAQLNPDAVRGDGKNSASVDAHRVDNKIEVKDGPAVYRVKVRPGLVSNCGTILGRVFVDKNFDGEQQSGEPGVPDAAIYMDDGNRITTDKNGLFSVKCVLPGYSNGSLDLTTLPGYTLAPNRRFVERNSPGRLVHLSPGGMVRMNFGVTPTFQEQVKP
jgi:uncharacterized repeat protein (TIGR01451 family)